MAMSYQGRLRCASVVLAERSRCGSVWCLTVCCGGHGAVSVNDAEHK